MTTIKAMCVECRDEVEMPNTEFTLHVYEEEVFEAYYTFECPYCQQSNVKAADDNIRALLVSANVFVNVIFVPAEVFERPMYDEALTIDYLIDLHNDLENFGADAAL